MMENRAQVSLEYLLIFSVSLIILIAFTMPLLVQSMDNTFDVSDSLKTKSDLSKIAQAIKQVYGEGQGAKQSVNVDISRPVRIDIDNTHIKSNIKLKNGDNKVVKINVKSKLETNSFKLNKGINTLVIEWPVGSENMILYEK
jgi:uncharacterized protein (UPF0333 family)